MQTIDFLNTAKWIRSQITDEIETLLFSAFVHLSQGARIDPDYNPKAIRLLHDLTITIEKFISTPLVPDVLRAFKLEEFLDRNFSVKLTQFFANANAREKAQLDEKQEQEFSNEISSLRMRWKVFAGCIDPIEELTIPKQVIQETDFDDVLTIILQYPDAISPAAETIAQILINTTELYVAIARLHGEIEFVPLRVIYVDSGSSIRVDLKGLGDPIRRLKELLVEAWNLIRYREVEDFQRNSRAILEGLKTIRTINSMREQGELPEEDALRLSKQILDSASALLNNGALPREVVKVEIIENQKILDSFQQKLLPAAPRNKEDNRKKHRANASKKPTVRSSHKSKKR